MRLSKARKLRSIIEAAMDGNVDDISALEAVMLFPEWTGTGSYEAEKRVQYEGALYRCLQEHPAQEGWDPVSAPSLWAKVLIPDDGVIPAWEQPGSTNPYMMGDKVCHNGNVWISQVDDNVWEPGVYGWEEVSA